MILHNHYVVRWKHNSHDFYSLVLRHQQFCRLVLCASNAIRQRSLYKMTMCLYPWFFLLLVGVFIRFSVVRGEHLLQNQEVSFVRVETGWASDYSQGLLYRTMWHRVVESILMRRVHNSQDWPSNTTDRWKWHDRAPSFYSVHRTTTLLCCRNRRPA